jgi:hypothetical protein
MFDLRREWMGDSRAPLFARQLALWLCTMKAQTGTQLQLPVLISTPDQRSSSRDRWC